MALRLPYLALGMLLFTGLAIRLGWGLSRPSDIDRQRLPDQAEYLDLGRNLLSGKGLSFYEPRFDADFHTFRTPGYPAFVAIAGGSVPAVRVLQAILDTTTALAIYLLARRWLSLAPALFAMALVVFNPFLIYFSALLLSETLFTAMLAWAAVLLAWRRSLLWGGIVLAVSVLVRPSAIALPVIMGYSAVFLRGPSTSEKPRRGWLAAGPGATMLALTLLTLLPWAARNHARLGAWVWLTTNGGLTRYDGFNPAATGASDQSFLMSAEMAMARALPEVEQNEYFSALADDYIRETARQDPMRLVRLTLAKVARTWSPMPLSSEFGGQRIYIVIALAYSIPLLLLAVSGMWGSGLPRRAVLFLLAPAMYFTVVHALSVGSLRYRVPVEPLLAVLAAAGAARASGLLASPAWRRSPLPL